MITRLLALSAALCLMHSSAPASQVTLETDSAGQCRLLCDGAPLIVKGAGGQSQLALLKACGANTLRTWGSEQTEACHAEAERLGLKICAGLWIEHERRGVDYKDPARFAAEVEKHCRAVDRLKDSPALLLWGVGNEVETQSTDSRVWDVIEAVAAYIRSVDPAHPVMIVTAHATPDAVSKIKLHCPSVQLLGCNSYRGLEVLARDVRAAGWTGPYLVTEWGNDGGWEVKRTSWGAELEPTSSEKAAQFRRRHALLASDPRCLGGLAFFWGQKQETTETWFNLFTEQGQHTEAVETLASLWGGNTGRPPAPRIIALTLEDAPPLPGLTVSPGAVLTARATLSGVSKDLLHSVWRLYEESRYKGVAGDHERKPREITLEPVDTEDGLNPRLRFHAPLPPGAYRLYYYGVSGPAAATANIPFQVK